MKFDKAYFDAGINRYNSGCVKWDDKNACPDGALPMWIADMDFACAPAIANAVKERAQHPCFGYSAHDGAVEKAFCDFWKRRHGLEIQPEQTVTLPGVVTGIRMALQIFTNPGDEIVIMTPVYGPFFFSVKDAERKLVECPLLEDENGHITMNYAAMETAFINGAKVVILCNPHNPVGRAWKKDELETLLKLCKQYGVKIIADEIHADFVYAPNHFVPMLTLDGAQDCVISLVAPSKTFNVAGLQHAHAVCFDKDILEKLNHLLHMYGVSSGNVFALAASKAAYEDCDEWLDGLIAYLDEGHKLLRKCLQERIPKAKMANIEATYLAWIDLRAYGFNTEELNERCRHAGVIFNKGTFFGEMGNGFVRINFGCPHAHVEEAVKRLAKALGEEEK